MNMKEGKYVNIQAEIQASASFHMRDIRGNDVSKFKEVCVGVHPDMHEHEDRKPTASVTETCY